MLFSVIMAVKKLCARCGSRSSGRIIKRGSSGQGTGDAFMYDDGIDFSERRRYRSGSQPLQPLPTRRNLKKRWDKTHETGALIIRTQSPPKARSRDGSRDGPWRSRLNQRLIKSRKSLVASGRLTRAESVQQQAQRHLQEGTDERGKSKGRVGHQERGPSSVCPPRFVLLAVSPHLPVPSIPSPILRNSPGRISGSCCMRP